MKENKTILLVIMIVFLSTVIFQDASTSEIFDVKTGVHEWYVDQLNSKGPWDGSALHPFQNISDALSVANPYDTIFVMAGTYTKKILLSYPISLIGLSNPVLDGGYNQTILTVKADDVLITNFTIQHSGGYSNDAGIIFSSGSNISFVDCVVHHTKNGIYIQQSSDVHFLRCGFFHNGNGINLQGSYMVHIQRCDFVYNAIAVVGVDTDEISLEDSTFSGNGISGVFHQGSFHQFKNCNLSDNSVNKGGFIFTNVSETSISNCLFYHNGDGISLSNCYNFCIDHCTFLNDTHFAVSMREPSENIFVSSSLISSSLRTAFYLEPRNKCVIYRSHLVGNYLYSILADPPVLYKASDNWWGTSLGPFHPEMLFSNKIKGVQWMIHCIPWSVSPFSSVGVTIDQIPQPRYTQTFDETPVLLLDGLDSDSDGAPDWWESKWGYDPLIWDGHVFLDPDGDALTNLEECYTDMYGSNPFSKDVFLEVDWMQCPEQGANRPNETLIQTVIDSFAEHNISLHIDIGDLGGGEPIPNHCDHRVMYTSLEDLYWNYFLHNDLTNPRKGIFHYGVICNYCPDLNFPFIGWDSFDGFVVSAEWLKQKVPWYDREHIIVGGIMHHLGHTLGLVADVFPGIDNVDMIQPFSVQRLTYKNYESSMNYLYKFTIFTYSEGVNGKCDFDDWGHLQFDFFKYSDFSR